MLLYTYYRSSAAFRVRIALNFKRLSYDKLPIHLSKDGGRQHSPDYLAINPHARVPAFRVDDGEILTQSMAIMEYLEETVPNPPLLPSDPVGRAKVRALAQMVVADIHPLNNLMVMNYLRDVLSLDSDARNAWYAHWIRKGFASLEEMIEGPEFCYGGRPSFADVCLVPQVFNARRYKVDISDFPKILAIEAHCIALQPFADARPEVQPDAEP